MRYAKTLIIVLVLFFLVVFGISNTTEYVLCFLDYQLIVPFPQWSLLMIFFFAGMLPIMVLGIRDQVISNRRIKTIEYKTSRLREKLSPPAEDHS